MEVHLRAIDCNVGCAAGALPVTGAADIQHGWDDAKQGPFAVSNQYHFDFDVTC